MFGNNQKHCCNFGRNPFPSFCDNLVLQAN